MGIERRIGGSGGESFDLAADHTFTGDVEFSEDVEINGQKIQKSDNNLVLRSGDSKVIFKTTGGTTTMNISHDTMTWMEGPALQIHNWGGNYHFIPLTPDRFSLGKEDYEWNDIHGKEIIATDIQQLPSYATRPTAAVAGRVIWNSDTGMPEFDTGSAWVKADGTGIS